MSLHATHHSREMMDFFLELVDAGTLDGARGFAMNDDWWSILYTMSTEKPDYCAEAIGHWLDRQYKLASRHRDQDGSYAGDLPDQRSQSSKHVISSSASGAPLAFAWELLPRVAQAADGSDGDAWRYRFGLVGEIVKALSGALNWVATEDPESLDALVSRLPDARPLIIDTLIMTAWASNPDRYGDRILELLIDQGELLGQPGVGRAVGAATRLGDPGLSSRLEHIVLQHAPDGERGRWYGHSQYRLLACFEADLLSDEGARRLDELGRKFGDNPPDDESLVPQGAFGEVPPRVPEKGTALMSDANWLRAMRTVRREGDTGSEQLDWDQVTLSRQLEARTKVDPERFATLAIDLMDDDLSPLYFSAVLDGLTSKDHERLPLKAIVRVLRRLHEIPGRPCGLSVVRAAGAIAKEKVPPDVLEAVAFYAISDPDPAGDEWLAYPGGMDVGERAVNAAINSVRARRHVRSRFSCSPTPIGSRRYAAPWPRSYGTEHSLSVR